ncbi:unnamed protein product [Ilex paraguariensis]|uniref:KIB1-4 beta-propeller domain-containing protein n=1 Tax=Ilex paraguariensis TaxID=185542 RepID=A0ABC8U5G1_9AQUA
MALENKRVTAFSVSGWAWLPKNLLDSVLDRMTRFSDFIRFRLVCRPWRLVALEENNCHRIQKQKLHILKTCCNVQPMLMIPPIGNNKENLSFCSVTEGLIHDLKLPMLYNRRSFGSSHGWLFTIEKSMAITLLNPFTQETIGLPDFRDPSNHYHEWVDDDDYDYFICKGILSCDPSQDPNNYEVAVIHREMRTLAFFKSGDESWIFIDLKENYLFSDLIYHEGQFHGINDWGSHICVDVMNGTHKVIVNRKKVLGRLRITYLVKSHDGDLLMVTRFLEENVHDDAL